MGNILKQAGGGLAIAGLISLALALFLPDYEVRILMWIESWGTGVAYLIRAGLIVGGGAMFVAGNQMSEG